LARHSWPGNIREFENVVRSAAIFAEGAVVAPDAFSHVAELRALLHEDTKKIAHASQSTPQPLASPPGSPSESTTPWTGGTALSVDYYEMARQRGISLKELRQEIETQCIQRALFDAKGNISEAARLLKMKRSRLSQIVNATPGLKAVTTDGSNESDEEE
jgi:DNA-binding NtrC family response regulator